MTRASLKAVLVGATLAVFASVQVMEQADARGRRGGGFDRGGVASAGGFSGRGGSFGQQRSGRARTGSRSGGRESLGEAAQDRREYRQDAKDDWREHRQDAMDDRREFRQDVAEDHWDDHRHWDNDAGAFVAGALVGGAIGAAAASTNTYVATLPCAPATVVVGGVTYFNCASSWYQQAHAGGQVTYVIVDPPPGY